MQLFLVACWYILCLLEELFTPPAQTRSIAYYRADIPPRMIHRSERSELLERNLRRQEYKTWRANNNALFGVPS